MRYPTNLLAQVYGGCAYGSTTYQTTAGTSCGTSAASAGTTSGTLTNTGFDVLLIASLACLIIFAALVIRFWKRPKK